MLRKIKMPATAANCPMMCSLRLQNFKAFGGMQHIPLRPITLIYGANSSGKTSILQALLLLKQTVSQSGDDSSCLSVRGDLVDLGSYREMIHGHELGAALLIGLSCAPNEPAFAGDDGDEVGLDWEFVLSKKPGKISLRRLGVLWSGISDPACTWKPVRESEDLRERYLDAYHLSLSSESNFVALHTVRGSHPGWANNWGEALGDKRFARRLDAVATELSGRPTRAPRAREHRTFAAANAGRRIVGRTRLSRVRQLRRLLDDFSPSRVQEFFLSLTRETFIVMRHLFPEKELFDDEALVTFAEIATATTEPWLMEPLALTMKAAEGTGDLLNRLVYLGPLRQAPPRDYRRRGSIPRHVGKSGECLAELLLARPELVDKLNEQMEGMDLPYALRCPSTNETAGLEDVFALRLVERDSQSMVSLCDVGFGVSQILPILLECCVATGEILCIEQPEIHLHPRAQAEFGDVIINAALGGNGYRNQLILETHSEHLLLRIMRRMRETASGKSQGGPSVTPEDVSLLYVDRKDGQSCVLQLRLARDGTLLDPWPGGFFEEGVREMFSGRKP